MSTLAMVVLGIPWLVLSLAVVLIIASLITGDNNVLEQIILLAFLLSGGLAFFRPAEDVIARLMFRVRRPTAAEAAQLDAVWGNVAAAAGVDPSDYRLWVQDTEDVNAFATSGHIVAVTRASLDLPPNHLAAVLAHELAHHLGGHAWAALLMYWYAIPGRLVARVVFAINYFFFSVVAGAGIGAASGAVGLEPSARSVGCLLGPVLRIFPVIFYLLVAWALYSINPFMLLVFVIPFAVPWFSRYAEKYADRVAADLGYGQPLVEVLYGWLQAGADDARKGLRATLFASHPSSAARIRALETHLYGKTNLQAQG